MGIFDKESDVSVEDKFVLDNDFIDKLYEIKHLLLEFINLLSEEMSISSKLVVQEMPRQIISHKYNNSKLSCAISTLDSINQIIFSGSINSKLGIMLNEDLSFDLLFASTNKHKVEEFNYYTTHSDFFNRISSLFNFSPAQVVPEDIQETEHSFKLNSMLKAKGYSLTHDGKNKLFLSEDSGLIVHSLSSLLGYQFPGVMSARFASSKKFYENAFNVLKDSDINVDRFSWDNVEVLRKSGCFKDYGALNSFIISSILTDNYEYLDNTASLNTFASLATNGEILATGNGSLTGKISIDNKDAKRNSTTFYEGFGYNPVFYLEDISMYLEEISPCVKIDFDHRTQAFNQAFTNFFEKLAFTR